MKIKKTSRKVALFLLTSGASLILGLLSFGGMFALWPVLPIAFGTFVLSIAYEAEIYSQNIKGAWNKLFKFNFLKRQLAKEFLLENFPDIPENPDDNFPQFFIDYEAQLELLHQFGHKKLNEASNVRKKQVEKKLRDMEKWFAIQLFNEEPLSDEINDYENKLRKWLNNGQNQLSNTKQQLKHRQTNFWWAKYFSLFSGLFMSLGTTYLLVETFSTIPWLAALPFSTWPLLILPMAVIAGAAYGLLTYNAATDMITNSTIQGWLNDLGLITENDNSPSQANSQTEKPTFLSKVGTGIIAGILVTLALGLTICTAGTWWTVVKETRPLFAWMAKIPGFIMGVSNSIIGLSAVVFNLENTRESLAYILKLPTKFIQFISYLHTLWRHGYGELRQHENLWQVFNPFRIALILTITPLRVILFLGHLISIGVTADRLPGVSQKLSALLGIISEFFEDLHYFFGHVHEEDHECSQEDHHHDDDPEHHHHSQTNTKHTKDLLNERLGKEHGHNHDLDIPTIVLEGFFTYVIPLYYLAAMWDWGFSQLNTGTAPSKKPYAIHFEQAKEKVGFEKEWNVVLAQGMKQPSDAWKQAHIGQRIERFIQKEDLSTEERKELVSLQNQVRRFRNLDEVKTALVQEKTKNVYSKQRFFGVSPAVFLGKELEERVGLNLGG